MTILRFLQDISACTEMTAIQLAKIEKSYAHLRASLEGWFGQDILEVVRFGSSSLGTMLPIRLDPNADIDCMVVFREQVFQQQTYLTRLLRFVESNYSRSSIYQDHPTIVVEMSHVKFELVPAVRNWFGGYSIPAKWMGTNRWTSTDPQAANRELDRADQNAGFQLRPLIRILKYWNVSPYEGPFIASYELESIVTLQSPSFWLFYPDLRDRFYSTMSRIQAPPYSPQWKIHWLERTRHFIEAAKYSESVGRYHEAEGSLSNLFR